jgi:hypothetical protein
MGHPQVGRQVGLPQKQQQQQEQQQLRPLEGWRVGRRQLEGPTQQRQQQQKKKKKQLPCCLQPLAP